MKKIIIAIDGYSACGKSTLAKALATRLGYLYIDSGAMYRAITLQFMRQAIALDDKRAVDAALKDIHLAWQASSPGAPQEIWLNGHNEENAIRTMAVAAMVSKVAALPPVREFAVSCQRSMGQNGGIVMDGRDIGTVVFPQAQLKLFMTASQEVRIERRYQQEVARGSKVSREAVAENLAQRDYLDTHRAISPLRQAPDAIVLDNSNLSRSEQLERALSLVSEASGSPAG